MEIAGESRNFFDPPPDFTSILAHGDSPKKESRNILGLIKKSEEEKTRIHLGDLLPAKSEKAEGGQHSSRVMLSVGKTSNSVTSNVEGEEREERKKVKILI